jgi:pteridine reductase
VNLAGRGALVTGGARRIGRAIVEMLAAEGMRVVIHHRRSGEEADALASTIRAGGGEAQTLGADLGDARAVERLADAASERLGGVDVLINNASVFYPTPVDDLDLAVWDDNLAVNLTAPYLLGIRLGRAMRARGAGKIVNLGDSTAPARPYRDYLPYSVAKAGVVALTRGLARALAPQVQVNCVAPGPILLPAGAGPDEEARLIKRTPLGRIGDPRDVAAAVLYLLREDYVTGATLAVDGGRSIT